MSWISVKEFLKKDAYLDWAFEQNFANCKESVGNHTFFIPFLVELDTTLSESGLPSGVIVADNLAQDSKFIVVYCPPALVKELESSVKNISISLPLPLNLKVESLENSILEDEQCKTIIGIIDFGGSVLHPELTSKISCFWDMANSSTEWDIASRYGRIASKTFIENITSLGLKTAYDRFDFLGDNGCRLSTLKDDHCTKVMNFAIDKQSTTEKLVVVSLPRFKNTLKSNLSADAHIVNAINFVINSAKKINPTAEVVINISAGINAGRKDGSSLIERTIADILAKNKNLKICVSAGNSKNSKMSLLSNLKPGSTFSFKLKVYSKDISDSAIEIHSFGNTSLKITSPDGQQSTWISADSKVNFVTSGKTLVSIKRKTSNTGSTFVCNFSSVSVDSNWTFTVRNDTNSESEVNVHVQTENSGKVFRNDYPTLHCNSTSVFKDANTLSCLASASGVIVAGSCIEGSGNITDYTSTSGKTKNGAKNTVVYIPVEKNTNNTGRLALGVFPGQITYFNGTSAAAPMLTKMIVSGALKPQGVVVIKKL